jgi:hypothetical protein
MQTILEIPPALSANLPDSMQTRFHAIPSRPKNSANEGQKPTFPQKVSAFIASFWSVSIHATHLDKVTYLDLPQPKPPEKTAFPPVK